MHFDRRRRAGAICQKAVSSPLSIPDRPVHRDQRARYQALCPGGGGIAVYEQKFEEEGKKKFGKTKEKPCEAAGLLRF